MKKCNNMGTSTSKNRNDKGEHEHGSTVAAVKDQSPVKKSSSRKMTKPLTNDTETEHTNIQSRKEHHYNKTKTSYQSPRQRDRKKKEEEITTIKITTITKEVTRRP